MARYANWSRLAIWLGKRDYRPEERGGSPVEKGARFSTLRILAARHTAPPYVTIANTLNWQVRGARLAAVIAGDDWPR
jgi:hypothetical protein